MISHTQRPGRLHQLLLATACLAACLAGARAEACDVVKVRVGIPDATAVPEFPWWYTPSSEQPAPDGSSPPTQGQVGLCNEILTAVCTRGDLDCEAVLMPFQDMVASVQNGTIDFAVDILSLTGERSKLVNFAYPGYYSAGVALYADPEQGAVLEAGGGWRGLAGSPVCVIEGYYSTDALNNEYNITVVDVADVAAGFAAVKADKCIALAYDTGLPQNSADGLPQVAGIPPVMTAPYAIPYQKGDDVLRRKIARRISASLVELMQDGDDSLLLRWEQDWLTNNGVLSNPEAWAVVNAISYFKGPMPEVGQRPS